MRSLALSLAALLLLAGCTQDGADSAPPSTTSSSSTSTSTSTAVRPDADTPLGAEGIGLVKAGMTLAEVREVGGRELVLESFEDFGGFCWFGYFEGLKEDFSFLFLAPERTVAVTDPDDGELGRVTVEAQLHSSPAETEAGIGIGSTKADVLEAYASDLIEVSPHEYAENGEYIDVSRSQDPVPTLLRFETDEDAKVTAIHGGLPDAARLVEGCA